MSALQKNLVLFFATGCYSGFSPGAPGTAGSVIGVALFWFLYPLSFPLYVLTVTAFIFLSIWCAARASAIFQKKDPSQVVIDEIAGYLVTMAALPPTWGYMIAGFILFRIMDIVKPYPIRWIDQNVAGGYGIVLDDVLAGVYANIILQIGHTYLQAV
jgi:phosphatidylglycerophosphatase A